MSKKGAELSINVMIGVALAVIALIILLAIFSSNSGKQSKEYNQYIEGKKKILSYINMMPNDFKEIQTKISKISSSRMKFEEAMDEIRSNLPDNKLMNLITKEGYDLCIIGENKNFFADGYVRSNPHQIICLFAEKQKKFTQDDFTLKKESIQQGGIYVGKSGTLQYYDYDSRFSKNDVADVYLCKCPID